MNDESIKILADRMTQNGFVYVEAIEVLIAITNLQPERLNEKTSPDDAIVWTLTINKISENDPKRSFLLCRYCQSDNFKRSTRRKNRSK
jgi:hypothetical protein